MGFAASSGVNLALATSIVNTAHCQKFDWKVHIVGNPVRGNFMTSMVFEIQCKNGPRKSKMNPPANLLKQIKLKLSIYKIQNW